MKISLEQVLKNSKLRLNGGPDAGKTVLERNFERMKTWKKSEVEELFDENNSLKKRGSKETQDDHKTLVSSRKLICTSLKMIINETRPSEKKLKSSRSPLCVAMAAELTSKENILKKFKNAEVEYNSKLKLNKQFKAEVE